jgi:hypothetical protein
MSPLEKKQRQFEHVRLVQGENKLLSAVRRRIPGDELVFARSNLGWLRQHNPGATLRASDARTCNALGHIP